METKLYVTNLPENCDQLELKALFEPHGNVLECVIMWNHYAFVHFADLREAKVALKHLHGHMFNGKNLIVQLSTSSNRPLPKCLAFSNNNPYYQNTNSNNNIMNNITNTKPYACRRAFSPHHEMNNFQEKKPSATILCYRANDSNTLNTNEQQQNQQANCHKDWITLLKMGNVPVQQMPAADSSVMNDMPMGKPETKTLHEDFSLSGIPTPDMPDLSSKIPSCSKKIISNQANNNINNYGFLNLATVKNEIKRMYDASCALEPVITKNIFKCQLFLPTLF